MMPSAARQPGSPAARQLGSSGGEDVGRVVRAAGVGQGARPHAFRNRPHPLPDPG
ncbi:MAG: hypothetical protein RIQ53_44, partial [Pseudomonadota bacterium]